MDCLAIELGHGRPTPDGGAWRYFAALPDPRAANVRHGLPLLID